MFKLQDVLLIGVSLFSEELKSWHRPRIHSLVAAAADLIAMETIPSIREAEALLELLREFPDCKAWLSFSCKVTGCPVWSSQPGAVRRLMFGAETPRTGRVYQTAARSLMPSGQPADLRSWSP